MTTVKLGDHIEILSGFAFKSDRFNNDGKGLPLVRIRDVKPGKSETYYDGEFEKRYLLSNGDMLVGMDGEFNCARWNGGPALLNQRVCRIRATSAKLDEQYLYWFLPKALKEIEDRSNFVTVKHLSSKQINEIEIPLPPLEEQKRIAAILDQADDIRRKRQHAIDRLNQLGQAIFHEMFGAEIASPNRVALGDLVEDFRYGTSNKSSDSGYPTLRIPNVVRGEIDSSDLKTVPLDDAEFKRLKLFDGDVLFVRTNGNPDYVGRSAVFTLSQANSSDFESSDWAYASYLIRARPRKAVLNSWFLQAYLSHPRGKKSLKERSKTSAGQYNINTEGLGSIPIPISPIEKQISFAKKIEDMGPIMQPLLVAAQDADSLFASLQHRAFTGQL